MSFFGFLKKETGAGLRFLGNTAVGLKNTAANAIDIANAGAQGVAGLARAGEESVFGTDKSYQDTLDTTQKAIKKSLDSSRGAYTYKEATSTDPTMSFLKPLVRNVATYAPLAIGPEVGFASEGAGIGTRLASSAATGAGVNTASTAASELADKGKIDPAELLKSAALGAGLGAGGEVIHAAATSHTPLNEIGAIGKDVNPESAIKIGVGPDSYLSVAKDELSQLAKATDVNQVKKVIGDALPANVVDQIAPAIVQTKDPNIVSNILSNGAKKTLPPPIVDTSLPPPTAPTDLPRTPDGAVIPPAGQGTLPPQSTPGAIPAAVDTSVPPSVSIPTPGAKPANPTEQNVSSTNPVQNVIEALRGSPAGPGQSPVAGIENLQKKQAGLYSAERGARLAKSTQAAGDLTGREATYAQLGALKGELPRVDSTALMEHLHSRVNPEDVNGILDSIRTSPNLTGYEPITAQNAIVKLFDEGKLPQPKEWEILQKATGSELTDTLKGAAVDSLSSWQKVKNFGVQVLGMPKAILASFDLSGGGRQGGVLGSRFIPEWGRAQKNSVKYFASSDAYEQGMRRLAESPNAQFYDKMDLNLPISGGHEEAFPNQLAEKIPVLGKGVAASDRAYTGGLADLRAGAADHIIDDLKRADIDPATLTDKQWKSIGQFLKTASGRGDLGALERHAVTLGEALFSPRLWKSRLDMLNPVYYAKLDPIARKYALQSAASFASIAGTVLGLAVAAGAKVETDARSSDFLKIKVGDTRYDVLGGFQQNLVLGHRLLTGEKKSSTTGAVTSLTDGKFGAANRLSVLSDFIQNKENPVFSTGQRIIAGTDKTGNPVNPATEIAKLAVPLPFQDTYKAITNTGSVPEGIVKSLPGEVGVGVGTYGKKDIQLSQTQKAAIKQLQRNGASQDDINSATDFFQTVKSGPSRTEASDKITKSIADNISSGDFAAAQKIADDYNKKVLDNLKPWLEANRGKQIPKAVYDSLVSSLIDLTDSTISTRVKSIATNPDKYKVKVGATQ